MKKVVLALVALVAIVIAVCFTLRSSANSKIEAKIEELKNNGFNVTYNKKNVPFKIEANGNIEVAYSQKVLDYVVSIQEEGDFKKNFQKVIKLFDKKDIDLALEGLSFDYDFKVNVLNKKLDLNLYLTKFSNSLMQELLASKEDKSSEILGNMLKNRDFQISFDENGNYKIKDINYIMPEETITLRGITGSKKTFDLKLLKLTSKEDDLTLTFEGIRSFYEEKANQVIDSKLDIANLEVLDSSADLKLKNIKISSFSKIVNDLLEGNSKIAFEDLSLKQLNTLGANLQTNLKDSFLEISFNKIPFKKYEEFMDVYDSMEQDSEKLIQKSKEFLEALSKAGIEISLNGNSKNLNLENKEWFKEFDFKSKFTLNKNLSSMKFEGIDDIFETINVDVKVDKESVEKATKELGLNSDNKIQLIDSEDKKFKVFKVELKADGLYINNALSLNKEALKFPKEEINNSYLPDNEVFEDNSKVSYSYKMLDKNTLRVDFKYESSLDKINSGGISVSFPQLKDEISIKDKNSKNFKSLDVYKAGDDLYSGILNKNVKASYLMVEGFDENWTDTKVVKEFSLDIDVTKLDDVLEINLRGYSSNIEGEYELVPTEKSSQTQDQQSYYIKIADVDLQEEKAKIK